MTTMPKSPEFGDLYYRKFGRNADVGSGDVPEDIWEGGGVYSFPATGGVVSLVSDDAQDDKGTPGTGAHTIWLEGLSATDWTLQQEEVDLDGVNPVTSTKSFIRLFRMRVVAAGTYETNVGTITASIGGSPVAIISPDFGQTLMAVFTIPADFRVAYLIGWYAGILRRHLACSAELGLYARPFGEGWQNKELISVNNAVAWDSDIPERSVELLPKTDLRVAATYVSADMGVYAGFDLHMLV